MGSRLRLVSLYPRGTFAASATASQSSFYPSHERSVGVIPHRANQTRATLQEYTRKLKEREKKERAGLSDSKKFYPDYTEKKTIEREKTELPIDAEDDDDPVNPMEAAEEARQLEKKEEAAPQEMEEEDTLIVEARSGESDIDEDAPTMVKDYDTDDTFEAAEMMIMSEKQRKDYKDLFDNEIDEDDLDDEDELQATAAKLNKERQQKINDLVEDEFRDSDKAIFAVIREYKREPFRIWKTLKHEQLGEHMTNPHMYLVMKLFDTYEESRPLLPEVFQWIKKRVQVPIHRRVYHFAVKALIQGGQGKKAVRELVEMENAGIKPMPQTRQIVTHYFSYQLVELINSNQMEEARELFNFGRTFRVFFTEDAYHAMAKMYISNDRLFQARDVLTKMANDGEAPDKRIYATLVGRYADQQDFEEAAEVLEEMDANNVYAPRSLSQVVIQGLKKSGSELAEEAEQAATFRYNLKVFNQQINETYQP